MKETFIERIKKVDEFASIDKCECEDIGIMIRCKWCIARGFINEVSEEMMGIELECELVGKPTESAWIKEKEYLLSEISGKVKCPACEKMLFIGNDYENPSLFCVCGYRAMIKLLKPT
jgi:hypothetical protein